MPKDPIFRNEEKKVIILNLFSIFDLVAWFNKNWRNSDKIRKPNLQKVSHRVS